MSRVLPLALILGMLAGCAAPPPERAPSTPSTASMPAAPSVVAPQAPSAPPPQAIEDSAPLPRARVMGKSRWTPVRWSEVPGFADDALNEAWNAWIRNCERPLAAHAAMCSEVRRLSIGTPEEQRMWMVQRLQPYRIEPLQGGTESLLTGYYEPVFDASRVPTSAQQVPVYRPPATLVARRPWYTRQEMDTLPQAQGALRGREIAYLADPLDALALQIQGSGRLRISEPDARVTLSRVAFAGSNEQPYRSVGTWLLQQRAITDASWPGIKAWARANPQRVQELLWSNPRVVFFREEPLSDLDAAFGPRGAQGVALTPGRSVAVDKDSIPYGTPVWLSSPGPLLALNRLVFAQDTGSAIVGAVRVDYFVGWGAEAGEIAGRLRQPVALWALWPR